MSSAFAKQEINRDPRPGVQAKDRFPSYGNDASVLADIYREEINIAIWKRAGNESLDRDVTNFLAEHPRFQTAITVAPDSASAQVIAASGGTAPGALTDNVAELVDMFCYLFQLKRAGLRLATLDRAMCPRFHVDRVPCRLVTTYHGVATEWLPHQAVDRRKLGPGSKGKSDIEARLFADEADIRQLNCGDVALLKGELWEGNENAGLVHRSPAVPAGQNRLLLSLDVCD